MRSSDAASLKASQRTGDTPEAVASVPSGARRDILSGGGGDSGGASIDESPSSTLTGDLPAARSLHGTPLASRRRVGTPVAENVLTDAITMHLDILLPVCDDAERFHLRWPDIATGIPDAVVVNVATDLYASWCTAAPPLASLSECRVLGAKVDQRRSPYSPGHENRLWRRLSDAGWSVAVAAGLLSGDPVRSSLVLEAKVADWRRGVGQLSRYRWIAHSAALVLPEAVAHRVPERALAHNRLGLAVVADGLRWRRRAPQQRVAPEGSLWLLELLRRATRALPP